MGSTKNIVCEICGSNTIIKEDDHFRCADCGVCYTSEQLKNKLKTAETSKSEKINKKKDKIDIFKSTCDSHKEEPVTTDKENSPPIKILNKSRIPLVGIIFITFLSAALFFVLSATHTFPKTSTAKKVVESYMDSRIKTDDISLKSVNIDSVDSEKFKTQDEDTVGYFAYMSKPMTLQEEDGTITEYENSFEKYGEDYDPESDVKWAYTVTGTYEATHIGHSNVNDNFRIICVKNTTDNMWYFIHEEYGDLQTLLPTD